MSLLTVVIVPVRAARLSRSSSASRRSPWTRASPFLSVIEGENVLPVVFHGFETQPLFPASFVSDFRERTNFGIGQCRLRDVYIYMLGVVVVHEHLQARDI